jgi:hypothetical protein
MKIVPANGRNTRWQEHRNTYCVCFFDRVGPGFGSSAELSDVFEATLSEVKQWAEQQAAGRWYGIALVATNDEGRGLVWLDGFDANRIPYDPLAQRLMEEMRSRPPE